MADTESAAQGDPHGWNSLENYWFLHDKHLQEHFGVLPGSSLTLTIAPTDDALYDLVVVEGIVLLSNGINLEVYKSGEVERSAARRIRMSLYGYNAWRPGGHNVLRYDNMHRDDHNTFHRHEFDPLTGKQVSYVDMTRQQFPVMHQILDELMDY